MLDEVEATLRVSGLVIVPTNKLDEVIGEGDSGLLVKDGRVRAGDKVGGDDSLVGVSEDALHGALGSLLERGADGLVGSSLLEAASKVNNRHIGGWHTEGHSSELSVEGRDDLSDGLGGSSGGRDDVVASGTSTPPVLLGRSIDSLLGSSDGVDGGHETLLEAELVVDGLGHRSEAVGGAGSVGDNVRSVVLLVVDAHYVHRSVRGRSGDDNLLGTTGHVHGSLLDGGEDAGGLNDVVNVGGSPGDFARVHFSEDSELFSTDGEGGIGISNDLGRVLSVDGIVLQHVLHVVGRDKGVVDGDDVDHRVVLGGAHDEASNTSKSVDSNVNGLDRLESGLAVDNVGELGLEGGSSDEESVNVGLLGEARSGCTGSRSSIKDTGVLGNVGSGNLAEVLPAVGMGLLGLLRGGGESSADGPDGLVSNDNPFPVLLGKCISVSLELREDEVVGGSSLTVLLRLTAARDDGKALVEGILGLGGSLLVGLSLSTALGVTDDSPTDTHVLDHVGGGLSGEGTVALDPDVLSANTDVGTEGVLDALKVDLGWAHDNFGLTGQIHGVEHGDKLVHLGNRSIALPVTSNKELPCEVGRRRVE
mmetsp:Transcript_17755/g.36891  ORF Transcript_17755/g.36891 Transcript_17755/m.36891 type:complete len:590 (+) Transcript_17755:215-1984(+)